MTLLGVAFFASVCTQPFCLVTRRWTSTNIAREICSGVSRPELILILYNVVPYILYICGIDLISLISPLTFSANLSFCFHFRLAFFYFVFSQKWKRLAMYSWNNQFPCRKSKPRASYSRLGYPAILVSQMCVNVSVCGCNGVNYNKPESIITFYHRKTNLKLFYFYIK